MLAIKNNQYSFIDNRGYQLYKREKRLKPRWPEQIMKRIKMIAQELKTLKIF